MRRTIFVLLSVAVLLPRLASATPARVDNSDYGIQSFGTPCAGFSDSSGMDAKCFFSQFSNGEYGFMVGFDSLVSNVEVTFSDVNIAVTGLVTCDTTPSVPDDPDSPPLKPCGETPTWDLDIAKYPTWDTLFSSIVTSTSAIFDLNGTIPATHDHGNEVAFLLLCAPSSATGAPAATDCSDATVSARSLEATAPVPEPASLLLFGSGAMMLARRVRNLRRQ